MNDDDSLLNTICGHDGRAVTERPFLFVSGGTTWRCATDGARLLMLEGADGDYQELAPDELAYVVNVVASAPAPTWVTTRQALCNWAGTDDGICAHCNGSGGASEDRCPECEGAGDLECDLGHTHNCDECDGTGWVEGYCPECNGRSRRKVLHGLLDPIGALVNRALLAGVVQRLDQDTVRIGVKNISHQRMISLYGDGWQLHVAGIVSVLREYMPDEILNLMPLELKNE